MLSDLAWSIWFDFVTYYVMPLLCLIGIVRFLLYLAMAGDREITGEDLDEE